MLSLLLSTAAFAHIGLTSHEARHGWTYIKDPPCGSAESAWGEGEVYAYPPGATVHLEWDEFIDHPGHYRVSFDPDGDDDFVDPADFDDLYTNEFVVADGIEDRDGGGLYTWDLVLPETEHAQATIQVVQVMTDKAPYGDGNDLYYNCVDLVISASAVGLDTGDDGASGKGCSAAGAASGLWLLALLGALPRRRR
jgi:hypothetical protein